MKVAILYIDSDCSVNPHDEITRRVTAMGETFCHNYTLPYEGYPGGHGDFARKRLQLGESLYYKVLENILVDEKKRLNGKKIDFIVRERGTNDGVRVWSIPSVGTQIFYATQGRAGVVKL